MPKSTKEGIQKALYELLRTKTLDEITVTELVEQCGISRQAFYYHFSDLYAVVDWTLQEKLEALNQIPGSQWWAMMNQIMEELYVNRWWCSTPTGPMSAAMWSTTCANGPACPSRCGWRRRPGITG